MKKTSIIAITCAVLLLTGAVLAGIGFMLGGGRGYYVDRTGAHVYEDGKRRNEELKLETFDSMQVSFPSGAVELVESDHFGLYYDIDEQYQPQRLEVSNGVLHADFSSQGGFMVFNFNLFNQKENMLKIYYPAGTEFDEAEIKITSGSFRGEDLAVKNTKLNMSSGSINLNGLKGDVCTIEMTSGESEVENLDLGSFSLQASSGGAKLENCKTEGEFRVKFTSGNVNLYNIDAGSVYTKFSSGDLKMIGCKTGSYEGYQTSGRLVIDQLESGGFHYESSSGDVKLNGAMRGANDIRITSGSVKIDCTLPEEEYSYTLKATSGSIRVNGDDVKTRTNANAAHSFNIKTTSGDVRLNFAQ